MSQITYLIGDATYPIGTGPKIIAHIVNDAGVWGAGFVLAVSKRWPEAERAYRRWAKPDFRPGVVWSQRPPYPLFVLGEVQLVEAEEDDDVHVANMCAQVLDGSYPPIRYRSLAQCLRLVGGSASMMGASVHMPRIGCGLAGGTWDKVEPLIQEHLCAAGVPVFVYDLPVIP